MGNQLVPSDLLNELAPVNSNFEDLTSASEDFFYRMQLYSSKSNLVQEGKINANHYGIPEDNDVVDLGAEVDVIILSWRAKALDTSGEAIIESFNPDSDTFKQIKDNSALKDSGCMYGPEFLLWVPSVERFLTFFMSSKTARREARKMEPLVGCAATIKSRIIKNGKFVWAGPVVIECSTPLSLPDTNIIKQKVQKFVNPPDNTPELADDDGRDR